MQTYVVRRAPAHFPLRDWSSAEPLTTFTFAWEQRSAPGTAFRALWSDTDLHFRFDCDDDDLVLAPGTTLKERVLGSDRVELFFTADLSLNPYYCFEMDARGEVLAYRARSYRNFDWDWRCEGLSVAASLTPAGYVLEGRLSFTTLRDLAILRDDPAPGHELHVGVYRADFSHRPDGSIHFGWLPWIDPHTPRPDFHVPQSFGTFQLARFS